MFTIPDIDKEARRRLYGSQVVATVEDARMSAGTPLFTETDINKTQDPLDILLRKMFVEKRISRDFFNAKCREKALGEGALPPQANVYGSNLVRAITSGHITMNRFTETLQVLNLSLVDMNVTVRTNSGRDEVFCIQNEK